MKARYEKELPRVRLHIDLCKQRGLWYIRAHDVAVVLGLKEQIVQQCFSVLTKERVLSTRASHRPFAMGHVGYYTILGRPKYQSLLIGDLHAPDEDKLRRVRWGRKKSILAVIRKDKPWVIEKWYEKDQRWWMYMESRLDTMHPSALGEGFSIAPEAQPSLKRTEISRWHFTVEDVLPVIALLRRKYPNDRFRARDTSKGDYIMGDILL